MRVKRLTAKTRSRFLATGLFLIGLSTAAGLTQPPLNDDAVLDPTLERVTLSAERAEACKQAG